MKRINYLFMSILFFAIAIMASEAGKLTDLIAGLIEKNTSEGAGALALACALVLVVRRLVLVPLFGMIPTKRRAMLGKLFWGLVDLFVGEEAVLKNYIAEEKSPHDIEKKKEELVRKFPILQIEPFKK